MRSKRVGVRILVSFAASAVRLVLSFFTGLMIARLLKPAAYGDYSFLLGSFAAIAGLLDMGTSAAFFTFVAQRQRGLRYVAYYGTWLGMQLALMGGVVAFLPGRLFGFVWLGQSRDAVLLALFMTFSMNQLWAFTSQLGESVRDTVGVQARNLAVSVLYLGAVVGLAAAGWVSVRALLFLGGVLYLTMAVLYAVRLYRQSVFSIGEPVSVRDMFADFAAYCYPSVVLASFAYLFLDGYFLQRFSGSAQQGFYGVAIRFASVALLGSSAAIHVLWKEVAEANTLRDVARVRSLLRTFSRGLVFATAVLGCALLPFSKEVVRITVGEAYLQAWAPFSIMMLYPVYQAMNVTHDVVLLAIAQTRIRNRVMLAFCILSLVTGYLSLAPRTGIIPGLDWGATGLAAKVLFCQALQANAAAYFGCRAIGATFDWKHQVLVLLVLVPLGFATRGIGVAVTGSLAEPLRFPASVSVAIPLYLAAVVAFVWRVPDVTGLSWEQLRTGARQLGIRFRTA